MGFLLSCGHTLEISFSFYVITKFIVVIIIVTHQNVFIAYHYGHCIARYSQTVDRVNIFSSKTLEMFGHRKFPEYLQRFLLGLRPF